MVCKDSGGPSIGLVGAILCCSKGEREGYGGNKEGPGRVQFIDEASKV